MKLIDLAICIPHRMCWQWIAAFKMSFSYIITRTTHLLPKNWYNHANFFPKTFRYWWFLPDYNTGAWIKLIELAIWIPDRMFWQWIAAIKMSFSFRTTLTTHLLPKNLSQQCKISNENVQIYMISAGLLYGSVHKTNRINYLYTWSYVLTMDCSNQNVFFFYNYTYNSFTPQKLVARCKISPENVYILMISAGL